MPRRRSHEGRDLGSRPSPIGAAAGAGLRPAHDDHDAARVPSAVPAHRAEQEALEAAAAARADDEKVLPCDLDERDATGATALHGYAYAGNIDEVRALMEAGADPNETAGTRGNTAMDIVMRQVL